MADLNTKTCDECGAVKREANHWFRYFLDTQNRRFHIATMEDSKYEMSRSYDRNGEVCGMECAVKAMTKALTETKL